MERWVLTPTDGRPLVLPTLARNGGTRVLEQHTPPPAPEIGWAARRDGQVPTTRGWQNREIRLKLSLERPEDQWWNTTHDFGTAPTEAEGDGDLAGWTGTVRRASNDGSPLPPMIADLTATIAALHQDGGTAVRVLDSNERITFDVLTAQDPSGPGWDDEYYVADRTTLEISMTCAPFGRGVERLLGSATKPTNRRLVTIPDLQVPGDVPALARLVLSGAAQAQRSLVYAIDQPDPTTTGVGLEVAATSLLPVAGAIDSSTIGSTFPTSKGIPAASQYRPLGAASPVMYLRTAAGAPLAVRGQYRALVRVRRIDPEVQPNGTPVPLALRLRWSSGARESGTSINPVWQTTDLDGWQLADLGVVTVTDGLDGVVERLNTYEAAAETTRSRLSMDELILIPTESSGRATASTETIAGSLVAADPATGSNALTGSAATVGGNWAGGGSGTDFVRTATGAKKTGGPRYAGLAVGSDGNEVSAQISTTVPSSIYTDVARTGLAIGNADGLACLVAAPNATAPAGAWAVAASLERGDAVDYLVGWVVVAVDGTLRAVARGSVTAPVTAYWTDSLLQYTLRHTNGTVVTSVTGWPDLTFETGLPAAPPGLFAGVIAATTSAAPVRFRNFSAVGSTAPDRLLHPGKTATVATDGASRENAEGLVGPFVPDGDRPLLPPSGLANRPVRVAAATSRRDLSAGNDGTGLNGDSPDAVTLSVYGTPRYLQIPDND